MPAAADSFRVRSTQLLRRLLEARTVIPDSVDFSQAEGWGLDLQYYMRRFLGQTRRSRMGPPSTAINLYQWFVGQLSELADETPLPSNDEQQLTEAQLQYLASMELWAEQQQHMEHVVGLGDSLLRLTWHDGLTGVAPPGVGVEVVTPDQVEQWDHPDAPGTAVRIAQYCKVDNKPALKVWSFGVIDEATAKAMNTAPDVRSEPYFAYVEVTGENKWTDITFAAMGEIPQWRWVDPARGGAPYLPWVTYSLTGQWWNPDPWPSLVQGTFDVALAWSFFLHGVRQASWKQKYGIGITAPGKNAETDGTHSVPADPTSMPIFEHADQQRGMLGVLDASTDPKAIAEAIEVYVRALLASLGFGGAQVSVSQPESGIAITLRRDQVKKLQRKAVKHMRRGDRELLRKVSLISNEFGAGSGVPQLPIEGWQVKYPALPMTHDEITRNVDKAIKLKAEGAASDVDVYIAANPGTSREEAAQRLIELRQEAATLAALATMPTPPRGNNG